MVFDGQLMSWGTSYKQPINDIFTKDGKMSRIFFFFIALHIQLERQNKFSGYS